MEKYSNKAKRFSIEQVVTLDIDSTGKVTQRLTNLETTLENTLLNALYPQIKVAVVNVPTEPLDAYEESQVENAMANLKFKNTPYKLVGASGSSKEGRFYFVDKDHSQAIAERFQEKMAEEIRSELIVERKELRKSTALSNHTANKAAEITRRMAAYMGMPPEPQTVVS